MVCVCVGYTVVVRGVCGGVVVWCVVRCGCVCVEIVPCLLCVCVVGKCVGVWCVTHAVRVPVSVCASVCRVLRLCHA